VECHFDFVSAAKSRFALTPSGVKHQLAKQLFFCHSKYTFIQTVSTSLAIWTLFSSSSRREFEFYLRTQDFKKNHYVPTSFPVLHAGCQALEKAKKEDGAWPGFDCLTVRNAHLEPVGCTYTRGLLQNRQRRRRRFPKAGIIPLDHQAVALL
jgi:hypothetical protein